MSSSSSPPPPSPSPGPRAQRLHQVYAASLARTLDNLSYENLAPCFPTIARRAAPLLRQVQSQMVQKLREKSDAEFAAVLRARRVVDRLNELEGVVAAAAAAASKTAGEEQPVAPHLLPPADILAAHLSPHLASHHSLLNAQLQTTQAQNALLAETLRRQRTQITHLLDLLDRAVDDVRGANAVLGHAVDDLAGEARAVDADLRDLDC